MATHEIATPTIESENVTADAGHRVYLPVSKEIAEALKLDETAHVSFEGVVKEVSAGYDDTDDYSVTLNIRSVTIENENEFEQMAREEEDDG